MFEVLEAVGQLTGLMQLTIWNVYPRTALHSDHTQLMQLTQLKQLTYLEFGYSDDYSRKFFQVRCFLLYFTQLLELPQLDSRHM